MDIYRCLISCLIFLSGLLFVLTNTPALCEEEIFLGEDEPLPEEDTLPKTEHEALLAGIIERLSSTEEKVRLVAAVALRDSVQPTDIQMIVRSLKAGGNEIKQTALCDALGAIGDIRAGAALRYEIEHGSKISKRAAISALGRLKSDWPVPILVGIIRREGDAEARKRAASALGFIGSTRALDGLKSSLSRLGDNPNDPASGVRSAVKWAISMINKEIDLNRTDLDLPSGRIVERYFRGMRYFLYHPGKRKSIENVSGVLRPRLFVCIHNDYLQDAAIMNTCVVSAKRRQLAVLAPYFDNMRFPDYRTFNLKGERADKALIELIDHVSKHANLAGEEFFLYGEGNGGDFIQRFILSYPRRVSRAVFVATDFNMMDPSEFFPKGLAPSPFSTDVTADPYGFVKTDVGVVAIEGTQGATPQSKAARRFMEAVNRYSLINGITIRVRAIRIRGLGYTWKPMQEFLFPESDQTLN